ncbi:DUF1090 domain-containing protein [Cupriavidus sp. 2TAF22]|uniref:DUF1090 domain-containing protein n=1 Tax=unclassified Cupriavidus TaxID=2640874 RepID=UPI003F8F5E02
MQRAAMTVVLCLFAGIASAQSTGESCRDKMQRISRQIDAARAHGNQEQLAGLETALAQTRKHCTDAAQEHKHQQKIARLRAKVGEREADLQKAQDNHSSASKIASRQRKLDDARAELARAEAPGAH